MNLGYEDALKLLQSSSETVELVLSQVTANRNEDREENEQSVPDANNYLE